MDRPDQRTHDKQWVEDRAFEGNGMRVQINKLPLSRRPHYSIAVGRIAPDSGMMKFIPVMVTGSGDEIVVTPVDDQLTELLRQAKSYIQSEIRAHEKKWLAEMGDRPDRARQDQRGDVRRRDDRSVGRLSKAQRDRDQRSHRGENR